MIRTTSAVAVFSLCLCMVSTSLGAGPTEQRRELSRAASQIKAAERFAKAGRGDDAKKSIAAAQEALNNIADGLDKRFEGRFKRAQDALAKTHAELTSAGIELPPLANVQPTGRQPNRPSAPAGSGPPAGGQVSFVDHVRPILTRHCGNCHVSGSRGGVSFANYASITDGNRFVERGSGSESLLVDVIASGQMPPSGNGPTPQEARVLVMWINQGAKFDGDDPSKPLGQLAKSATPATPAKPAEPKPDAKPIPMATGDETVSFAVDIAPLLTESCNDCHGTRRPSAGFSVTNFQRLWAGGNSGSAVVPGDSKNSLLVKKLHGTADGARMPQNRPAWNREQINLVERWIDEGAKFDGPSATESLERVSAVVRSQRLTPEQLSADRQQKAEQQWRLAIPDEKSTTATSKNFLAIGNLPPQRLEQLLTAAEGQAAEVAKYFQKADEPFSKARVTIFAFDHRVDYSEFGTMVERRSLPTEMRGHSKFDLVYPYVALVVDPSDDDVNQLLVAQQLASLWVADQADGRLPAWFAEGAGMAIAARVHKSDPTVDEWRGELPAAVASLREPDAFINGKLPPAATATLSFGFADALLQKRSNLERLMTATAKSGDFDAACQQVFKRSPKELAELWVATERRRR
ncbi:c-type cytochrome domain-containing protein [Aeoliella sp.]|uniref:c-type cytochrome domain-containing protein n=1 Tax=Aeoliella sp. TaxID=2795800 RepID=UPI003CCC382E